MYKAEKESSLATILISKARDGCNKFLFGIIRMNHESCALSTIPLRTPFFGIFSVVGHSICNNAHWSFSFETDISRTVKVYHSKKHFIATPIL